MTEDDSSSVADATDCTLVEASSEAAATVVASSCERSAVEVSVVAEASSSVEADATVSTISPTARSKPSASCSMSARRCAAVRASASFCSRSIRILARPLSLNTSAVLATSPTSSRRSVPRTATS